LIGAEAKYCASVHAAEGCDAPGKVESESCLLAAVAGLADLQLGLTERLQQLKLGNKRPPKARNASQLGALPPLRRTATLSNLRRPHVAIEADGGALVDRAARGGDTGGRDSRCRTVSTPATSNTRRQAEHTAHPFDHAAGEARPESGQCLGRVKPPQPWKDANSSEGYEPSSPSREPHCTRVRSMGWRDNARESSCCRSRVADPRQDATPPRKDSTSTLPRGGGFRCDARPSPSLGSGGRDSPLPRRATADCLRIALYCGKGTSGSRPALIRTVREALGIRCVRYKIEDLHAHAVHLIARDDYDVVIFPGGNSQAQATAIGEDGLAAIKEFVASGGGYIGTCAGAVLAITYLRFYGDVPTKQPWDRGAGNVEVEFTTSGLQDLRLNAKAHSCLTVLYGQGPIVAPESLPPTVRILANFRTEIHSKHTDQTKGAMVGTPAVTSTMYGKGRVLVNSPHPELTEPSLPDLYYGFLAWTAPNQMGL